MKQKETMMKQKETMIRLMTHKVLTLALVLAAAGAAQADVVEVSGKIVGVGVNYTAGTDLRLMGDTYFAFWKPGGFSGDIDLNGFKMAAGGSKCRFAGAITGEGEFRQKCAASMTLSGNKPNTFRNPFIFVVGGLTLDKPAGIDAVPGDLVMGVQSGSTSLTFRNSDQINDSSHILFEARSKSCAINMGGNKEQIASITVKNNLTIDMSDQPSAFVVEKVAADQLDLEKSVLITNFKEGQDKLSLNAGAGGLTPEQMTVIGFINPAGKDLGTYSAKLDSEKCLIPGSKVVPINPPFDLSEKARAKREKLYNVPGIEELTGPNTPLKAGMKIVVFGDSITMQGRYVRFMGAALSKGDGTKDLGIKLVRYGLNGGRVHDLLAGKSSKANFKKTMKQIIQEEKPDIITVWVGVNDIWFGEKGTNPEDFEDGLRKIMNICLAANAKVVLAPPAILGEDAGNWNPKVDQYADITRKVAKETGATVADLRKACVAFTQNNGYDILPNGALKYQANLLAFDGVHFNDTGSDIVVDLISQAICNSLKK